MEKALRVINDIQKLGIIRSYAIGGGIAVTYYVEPVLTFDLDVFFIPVQEGLDVLSPIFNYLKKRRYKFQKERIIIERIPVQFIPVYNDLVRDAVEQAIESKYKRVKTKIFRPEHLLAIALQTYRPKDRDRIIKLLDEARLDFKYLIELLRKYGLHDKYLKFKSQFYEK